MGVEAALIMSAVAAAGSTVMSGVQQQKWGKYENEQAKADAAAAQGAAAVEASRIREIGARRKASARAALAANGIRPDEGVGDMIQSDIDERSEQDALTTILNGSYQGAQLRRQGQIAETQGKEAMVGSVLKAAGQAASAYGGWKKQVAGKTQGGGD